MGVALSGGLKIEIKIHRSTPKQMGFSHISCEFEYSSVPNRRVGKINVQGRNFLENIKRAGWNRRAGGKFSGKSIILQVILIFETEKLLVHQYQ